MLAGLIKRIKINRDINNFFVPLALNFLKGGNLARHVWSQCSAFMIIYSRHADPGRDDPDPEIPVEMIWSFSKKTDPDPTLE